MNEKEIRAIIDSIVQREGGYVDHPNDVPTKYGITQDTLKRFLNQPVSKADIANLQRDDAESIYREEYVKPFEFITDLRLGNFLVNSAVQHGTEVAARWLQAALQVQVDGRLGPVTQAAYANVSPQTIPSLLLDLVQERLQFYANILHRRTSKWVFAAGWLNRLADDLTVPKVDV